MLLSAALILSTTILVSSYIPVSVSRFRNIVHEKYSGLVANEIFQRPSTYLNGGMLIEFDGEDEDGGDPNDTRTDEEKGLTHGYEGDFKIGDVVKVIKLQFVTRIKIVFILVCCMVTNLWFYVKYAIDANN